MKDNHLQVKNFNYQGINTDSSGDLHYRGKTYFYGKHIGDITQLDNEEFIAFQESELQGNLKGINVTIQGCITGDIEASERLTLTSTALIKGNLKSKNFEISPGAKIQGQISSME